MSTEVTNLWENSKSELRSFIAGKVKHHADPDDILQDVFLKVMQNEDKLLHAHDLRKYLNGMVRNAVYDVFRNTKRKYESDELLHFIPVDDMEETVNESIADCCLQSFIKQLPDKYRHALVEVELKNIPQKDLALQLGISYSAAKSRVQRAREKLKALILACCQMESDQYGNLLEPEEVNCGCPTSKSSC